MIRGQRTCAQKTGIASLSYRTNIELKSKLRKSERKENCEASLGYANRLLNYFT